MHKKFLSRSVTAIAALGLSAPLYAVDPMPIDLGGVYLTPTLDSSTSYSDNYREIGIQEESTWITSIEPSLLLSAQDRNNVYELEYSLNSEIFHSFHDDDNTDHFVDARGHMEFDRRNRLDLEASYSNVEEVRDATVASRNDKYELTTLEGVYGFGVPSATMQLDLGARQEWLRYDNDTILTEAKDRDSLSLWGTGYYRVAPKTRALVEYRNQDHDYQLSGSLRDSTDHLYLVGVTWEATAKTTGTVKVGYQEKDFDASSIGKKDGSTWEASVDWGPRTYSTFSLTSRKGLREARFDETFVDTMETRLDWNHEWTSVISTDAHIGYVEEDFGDSLTADDREDETRTLGFDVNYDLDRWVTLGLGYEYQDKQSDVAIRDYDRNLFMLNVQLSL